MDKNQINLHDQNDVDLVEELSIDAQLTILADIIANLLLKQQTEEDRQESIANQRKF